MSISIESSRHIFPETLAADVVPAIIARFKQLTIEDRLALIWFAYLEMGKKLSIATPDAVNMQFVRTLEKFGKFKEKRKLNQCLPRKTRFAFGCGVFSGWSVASTVEFSRMSESKAPLLQQDWG